LDFDVFSAIASGSNSMYDRFSTGGGAWRIAANSASGMWPRNSGYSLGINGNFGLGLGVAIPGTQTPFGDDIRPLYAQQQTAATWLG